MIPVICSEIHNWPGGFRIPVVLRVDRDPWLPLWETFEKMSSSDPRGEDFPRCPLADVDLAAAVGARAERLAREAARLGAVALVFRLRAEGSEREPPRATPAGPMGGWAAWGRSKIRLAGARSRRNPAWDRGWEEPEQRRHLFIPEYYRLSDPLVSEVRDRFKVCVVIDLRWCRQGENPPYQVFVQPTSHTPPWLEELVVENCNRLRLRLRVDGLGPYHAYHGYRNPQGPGLLFADNRDLTVLSVMLTVRQDLWLARWPEPPAAGLPAKVARLLSAVIGEAATRSLEETSRPPEKPRPVLPLP